MSPLRFVVLVGLLFCATCAWAADEKLVTEKSDAEKPDSERIVGTWTIESADGPLELLKDADHKGEVTFEDGKMKFKVLADGNPILQIGADYVLDDKQTPKLLDLTLTGDGGGNQVFAIYELQNDKLRIRFRTEGAGARPVDFAVPDETCRILTFVRRKVAK